MRLLTFTTFLAVIAGLCPAATAQLPGFGGQKSGEELVPVRAIADVEAIRPGQTFTIAVVFDIEPGWHIYWINAGASGLPTSVEVKAPKGFTVGATRFPRPKAFRGEEGLSYGYERQTALFVPVTAPAELTGEDATFALSIGWLVCKGACLMGAAERSVTVRTVSETGPEERSDVPKAVRTHEARLPKPIKALPGVKLAFDGQTLVVTGPARGFDRAELFPVAMPGVRYGAVSSAVVDDRFELRADVTVKPANARGKPMAFRGVIALGSGADDPCFEFDRPVNTEGDASPR
ncbi:MAG: protein-disulfide reductase DsbD domain-containing protein [Planctomycetota bacterium]|jgi:thiol:disulfide interchange protein DsbD